MKDTICAIATLVGESSINVIRISGDNAISIVNKIWLSRLWQPLFFAKNNARRSGVIFIKLFFYNLLQHIQMSINTEFHLLKNVDLHFQQVYLLYGI